MQDPLTLLCPGNLCFYDGGSIAFVPHPSARVLPLTRPVRTAGDLEAKGWCICPVWDEDFTRCNENVIRQDETLERLWWSE